MLMSNKDVSNDILQRRHRCEGGEELLTRSSDQTERVGITLPPPPRSEHVARGRRAERDRSLKSNVSR